MRRWVVAAIVVAVVGQAYLAWWFLKPGVFSHANYARIHEGMSLADVETLLGEPGRAVEERYLPFVVDRSVEPRKLKPVISGQEYYQWDEGARYIIISLRDGVVAEKYYWEPSL